MQREGRTIWRGFMTASRGGEGMSYVSKPHRSTRARSVCHGLQVLAGTRAIVASSSGKAGEASRTAGDPASRVIEAKFSAQAAATFNSRLYKPGLTCLFARVRV